jgi:hypothetical protein
MYEYTTDSAGAEVRYRQEKARQEFRRAGGRAPRRASRDGSGRRARARATWTMRRVVALARHS